MECHKVETYLADYLQNELGIWTKLRVAYHLKRCGSCQSLANQFHGVLGLLQECQLPEPPPKTWDLVQRAVYQAIPHTVVTELATRCSLRTKSFFTATATACLFLLGAILGWLILPARGTAVADPSCSLFWSFFNADLWDFSNFFSKVNQKTLSQITPDIEKAVHKRLAQELDLSNNDTSHLLALLRNFGYKMKDYYDHYCTAMASLAQAIDKGEHTLLQKALEEVQLIRQKWAESRWQFLREVQFILTQKQFARFLIFAEKMPQELLLICSRLTPN